MNPDPTLGTGFTEGGTHSTLGIPIDAHVSNGPDGAAGGGDDITQLAGLFTMWGGSLTSTSGYSLSGSYAGDGDTSLTITFTASSTSAVLASPIPERAC